MEEKKLTDEEIVKALECKVGGCMICESVNAGCPYDMKTYCDHEEHLKDILDLIHRLQEKRKKIGAYNVLSDATLFSCTKGDLIDRIRVLEHNWSATEEALDNSAKNGEKLLAEQKAEIERLKKKNAELLKTANDVNDLNTKLHNESIEIQKQVDELTEKLGKVLLGIKADEVLIAKGVKQAVKETAKKYNDFVHALICKYNSYIDRKDEAYGNMHKEASEFAKERYGVEVE